jgi:hypothetical protein
VADNAVNLGIDQLLGNDGALLRIGRVVLVDQFKFNLGATDFHAAWR